MKNSGNDASHALCDNPAPAFPLGPGYRRIAAALAGMTSGTETAPNGAGRLPGAVQDSMRRIMQIQTPLNTL